MKKIFLVIITVFYGYNSFSQSKVIYEEFQSYILDQSRRLKIQLPRNYEENTEKVYPIVVVLDANYLFEPVAGNVDYFSYWEDMPESIVVGIMQGDSRYDDCNYDSTEFMPDDTGFQWLAFIDAGSLWGTDFEANVKGYDDMEPRITSGLGLAMSTPIGPLQAIWGFPIASQAYDVDENFQFSIGTSF